jgi:hypothetical protein
MTHRYERFTKFKPTTPATWRQIKAVTRLCERVLGIKKYHFGLQHDGIGLTCLRRANTAHEWKSEIIFDSRGLCVHFGSEVARIQRDVIAVRATTASHNVREADDNVQYAKKEHMKSILYLTKAEERHKNVLIYQTRAKNEIPKSERKLMEAHHSVEEAEDKLVTATLKATVATSTLEQKEQSLKKKKKKYKRAKKKKDKANKQAKVEQAELELTRAQMDATDASKERVRYEKLFQERSAAVSKVATNMEEAQLETQKAGRERAASGREMAAAMRSSSRSRVQLVKLERIYDAAVTFQKESDILLDHAREDPTFANWPSRGRCELPNDFKNYESYQQEDDFILMTGNTIDIYFQGDNGQMWTKDEMIKVSAAIGNCLGWEAIGGKSCTAVQVQMDQMLAADKVYELERKLEEQKFQEERRLHELRRQKKSQPLYEL